MIPNTLPQGLIDNPKLGQWIGFEDTGWVRVSTGKAELGQGILTAITQIAADELDVAIERIRIVSADTQSSPAEAYTVGSLSVQNSGGSVRLVAAEIRALMLDAAAARLNVARETLSIADGSVLRSGAATGLDYWSLVASIDLACPATGSAPIKVRAARTYIGTNVPRVDLPAKVAPQGPIFVHDIQAPGLLHARTLRQPWPKAELATSDAELAVLARDAAFVRQGNFLAVIAESERTAEITAARLAPKLNWTGGVPVPDTCGTPGWVAQEPSVPRVSERGRQPTQQGRTIAQTYNKQFIAHASIGPSCAVARDQDGMMRIWSHSQGVGPMRNAIARLLGRDPASIHVTHVPGAGCYGHNGADDAAADAAFVAQRMPGKAIRVQFSREDELASAPLGAAMQVSLSATVDDTGVPLAWATEIWSYPHGMRPGLNGNVNLSAFEAIEPNAPRNFPEEIPEASGGSAARNAWLLYDIPRQTMTNNIVPESGPRTSSMRGLGAFANVFAIESFMDELAATAGVDPIQYRLRLISDARARAVIERAASMASWSGPRGQGDGRGRGFAYSRYKNRAGYCALIVDVEVAEEVRLEKVWCAADAGLAVSPDGVANQIEGGIIQGASWALKENVRFEAGRSTARSWADYPILKFTEVPPIEIDVLQHVDAPMLGMGEVSQGPIGAAIANAVADALGVRIRDLPLTRDRIMAAIG